MTPALINFRRIIGLLLALCTLVLLQACSAIKLAYNNAPQFAYFWLDGYVDFREDQSVRVKEDLDKFLAWHRTEELPKLGDLLQKVQKMSAADMTTAQVCRVFDDARERYNAVTRFVEPSALWLASGMANEQIKHLETKLNKAAAQWQKDWQSLPAAERFEKRLKGNVERAEEFYGKLEERQVAVLKTAMEVSQFDPALSATERQRRQADLLQTLRTLSGVLPNGATAAKPPPAEAQALLRAYVQRVNRSPNAAYNSYSDKLTTESCATFAQLHNTTSPAQRDRAQRRLAAYERDARELNSQR